MQSNEEWGLHMNCRTKFWLPDEAFIVKFNDHRCVCPCRNFSLQRWFICFHSSVTNLFSELKS